MKRPTVLVSSSSNKQSIFRILREERALHNEMRIVAGDQDVYAPSQHIADLFIHMPLTIEENWSQIRSIIEDNEISLIIPTRDSELMFWSRHKEELALAGTQVAISSDLALSVFEDKLLFSQETKGFPIEPLSTYKDPEKVQSNQIVVKERFGSGANKIIFSKSRIEALKLSVGINNPIFQDEVEGLEVSADAFFGPDHDLVGFVTRRRLRIENGESAVTETFRNPSLEEVLSRYLTRLGKNFGLFGPIVLQLFWTAEDNFFAIELNPRFGGASSASDAVGLKSLGWLVDWSVSGTKIFEFHRTNYEIRQTRIPGDQISRINF